MALDWEQQAVENLGSQEEGMEQLVFVGSFLQFLVHLQVGIVRGCYCSVRFAQDAVIVLLLTGTESVLSADSSLIELIQNQRF